MVLVNEENKNASLSASKGKLVSKPKACDFCLSLCFFANAFSNIIYYLLLIT